MRACLEWSDVSPLRSILLFLDTQCWQNISGTPDEKTNCENRLGEIKAALESTVDTFRDPLEAKGATLNSILDEIEEAGLCQNLSAAWT